MVFNSIIRRNEGIWLMAAILICTFAPNVGSRADATKGKDLILFLEEIGENMRNIDRQMRLLKMNGVLTSTEISRLLIPPQSPQHRHLRQLACGWQERL